MKKLSIALLMLVMIFALVGVCACQNLKDYAAPTITAANDGLVLSHAEATAIEYSVDGGDWQSWAGTPVSYSTAAGTHTVQARLNVEDAKEILTASFTYETKNVSLEISLSGATLSWVAVGKSVSIKVGELPYAATTETSYTNSYLGTTVVSVRVEGGWDEATETYYNGSSEETESISVVKLQAPVLACDGVNVTWQDVANATKYMAKVDNGEFADATSVALTQEVGTHVVTVYAVGNGQEFLDSEVANYTYHVQAVTLSDIETNGTTFAWSATAKEVTMALDAAEATPTTQTSCTVEGIGTHNITVVAAGGWIAETNTMFVGNVEKTASITIEKLATPQLTISADEQFVLTWQEIANAVKVQAKVDGDEFADATSVDLSKEVGTHTVIVKAIGNGTTILDSDEATVSYEVKNASVEVTKDSSTHASWVVAGRGTQISVNGGEYVDTTATDYTATQSCHINILPVAGWDAATNTLWIACDAQGATLVVGAANSLVLEDAEDKCAADLQDEWTIRKYADSNWKECGAGIGIAQSFDGGNAVDIIYWDNYSTFRYSKKFNAVDGYNALEMDVKGNGVTDIKLQLANSQTGVYATYNCSSAKSAITDWSHVVISLADEGWTVDFSGQKLPLASVIGALQMKDISEAICYFDTFNIILYGETPNGNSAHSYIDNIKFTNIANVQTGISAIMYDIGTHYTAQLGEVVFDLSLTSATAGTLQTLNLEQNIVVPVTVEMNGNDITLKDAAGGSALTLGLRLSAAGSVATQTNISGTYAAMLGGGTLEFHKVYVVNNFESYTETGVGYDKTHGESEISGVRADFYSDYYSGSGSTSVVGGNNWDLMGSTDYLQLATEGHSGNQSLKVKANSNTLRFLSWDLYKGTGAVMGKGSTFSFWAKGGSVDVTLKIRISYTKQIVASNQTSFDMTEVSFTIPANSGWTQYTIELKADKTPYGIVLLPKTNGSTAYFLIDDIEIFTANPYAAFVPHVCENVCPICGKCTNPDCSEKACLDKCQGHAPVHACESICPICGKCTNASCTEDACAQKCDCVFQDIFVKEDFSTYTTAAGNATQQADIKNITAVVSGSIYVRNDAGSGNGDSRYMTAKYANTGSVKENTVTFTLPNDKVGYATQISLSYANNRNVYAAAVSMTISAIGLDGSVLATETFDVAANAGFATKTLTFERALVQKIVVKMVVKENVTGDAYMKLDDWTVGEEVVVHTCESICPTCGKCTNGSCQEDACADKCQGHSTTQEVVNLKLDFEDGAGSGAYTSALWTQETYNNSWTTVTGKMNSRVKDNSKVANFYAGYKMTYRYTYTPASPIGDVDKISLKLFHDFSGGAKSTIQIKVKLVTTGGSEVYVVGTANTFSEIPFGTVTTLEIELPQTVKNVSYFVIILKNTGNGDDYLYLDDIVFSHMEEVSTPSEVKHANLLLDFEEGSGNGTYTSSDWTQVKLDNGNWVAMANSQMNSKTNGTKIVNFVGGWSQTRRFIYNYNGESLGLANHASIQLGNYYDPKKPVSVKIVLVDTNGNEHYLLGGENEYYSFAATDSLITLEQDFAEIEVACFYVQVYSSYQGNQYLYCDNITLTYSDSL